MTLSSRGSPPPVQPTTVLEWLGQRWEAWLDIWHVLKPMRFSVFILIVAAPFLLVLPQSRDALLALIEDAPGHPGQALLFILFWFGWAFSSFYWARFTSRLDTAPPAPRRYKQLISQHWLDKGLAEHLPHWLGHSVIVLVALALIAANTEAHRLKTDAVILGVALALWSALRRAIRDRRKWMNTLARHLGRDRDLFRMHPTFERDLTGRHGLPRSAIGLFVLIALASLAVFSYSALGTVATDPRPVALWLSLTWLGGAWLFLYLTPALPPSTKLFVALYLAGAEALFVVSLHSAESAGLISSPVIFMAIFALWVFGGTFFLAYPAAVTGLPTTTALLVVAALMTLIGNRDNHAVRQLKGEIQPATATPVIAAFDDWFTKASAAWHSGGHTGPVALVILATAGGASRAGYWTTRLLTDFEQRIPGFHNYLFAISSVSGGSLGTGIYRAMLNRLPDNDPTSGHEEPGRPINGQTCARQSDGSVKITRDNFARCGLDAVQRDFLSPTFLTGLFADLTQRVLPGALLPDRGTALERAWEAATRWKDGKPSFDSGFHAMWPTDKSRQDWLPALLINGTSAKSGRRIITSNLAIADPRCASADPQQRAACPFPDAIDFFDWMKREVRFSTAIHNSARFPYIDAAGTLRRNDAPVDRIIDGGYFENFGAGTLFDLVETLRRAGRLQAPEGQAPKLALFVVQISSDPGIKEPARREADLDTPVGSFVSEVVTPLEGFYNTRDGLGTRATRVLEGTTGNLGKEGKGNATGSYFHFRLYDNAEPMSWALSDAAAQKLYQEMPEGRNCKPKPNGETNLAQYCNFVCDAGFRAAKDCPSIGR